MKVFLSSTYIDLIEHRKAAHKECHVTVTLKVTVTSRMDK